MSECDRDHCDVGDCGSDPAVSAILSYVELILHRMAIGTYDEDLDGTPQSILEEIRRRAKKW